MILALPPDLSETRVAYFLSYTSLAIVSTTSLPLLTLPATDHEPTPSEAEATEEAAGKIMEDYLALLDSIDQAWLSLLTGWGWHTPRRFLAALYEEDGELGLGMFKGSIGHPHGPPDEAPAADGVRGGAEANAGGQQEYTEQGGHVDGVEPQDGAGAGQPNPPIDATSQIRLKSILQLSQAKVLAWARPYGDFGGEVLGPDGDEGRESTLEEKEGWEGCVLRLFTEPIAEIDLQTGFDPETRREEQLGLPRYFVPIGPLEERDMPVPPEEREERDMPVEDEDYRIPIGPFEERDMPVEDDVIQGPFEERDMPRPQDGMMEDGEGDGDGGEEQGEGGDEDDDDDEMEEVPV